MKTILIILLLSLSFSTVARDIIDVYGVDLKTAAHLKKRYEKQIRVIETQFNAEFKRMSHPTQSSTILTQLLDRKKKLIQTIKKEGHYQFVDFQTISYPGVKDIYTTIEIVANTQLERLKFLPNPNQNHVHQANLQPDLIDAMIEYQFKAMHLLITNQLDLHDQTCPVYHCTVPFNHPTLKPYLTRFNQGVLKEKDKIIHTLNEDPDPMRRAAAAFLIGHVSHPHEIISLLMPHITDADSGVRNNTLRVIGETIMRAKITTINPLPFLALLDSPYVTDRNKALLVLLTIADSKSGQRLIQKHEHGRLQALLRLKQPNNHDIAELIMKKLKRSIG